MIATGEFPTNLCAIKLLTELVTNQPDKITDAHVDNVMPNIAKVSSLLLLYLFQQFNNNSLICLSLRILKRTDDAQSMVRKAAVFCIVRFYVVLGEDRVKPKFSLLNSSKIR